MGEVFPSREHRPSGEALRDETDVCRPDDTAGGWIGQTGGDAEKRRLARAVVADNDGAACSGGIGVDLFEDPRSAACEALRYAGEAPATPLVEHQTTLRGPC